MHPHRGMVRLNGLTQARERATPHRTPEEVGEALGVNGRTVRRWEETGWVKIRYVDKLERLYGVTFPEAHRGEEPGDETGGAIAFRGRGPKEPPPATDAAPAPTLDSIKQMTALYDARRLQGAPTDQLRQLRTITIEAIRVFMFRDSTEDAEFQTMLAEKTFERYTQASAPPVEPQMPSRAAAAKRSSEKKRR